MGALASALLLAQNLKYLDLNRNAFNYFSSDAMTNFLKETGSLEYLSMRQCKLKGKTAEAIADALMMNNTIKYLDLSENRLTSPDHIIAAKLGRLIQGC